MGWVELVKANVSVTWKRNRAAVNFLFLFPVPFYFSVYLSANIKKLRCDNE